MDQLSPSSLAVYLAMLVLLAPFGSFLLSALSGKKMKSGWPATIAIILSLIASVILFFSVWNKEDVHQGFTWFTIGQHRFELGVWLNNLTVLMLLLVCLIALPVHIYSAVYMKGDEGIHRYWLFLSLFCFAMLGLVMASSLLTMYIGWELVGFSSYLLIGFWYTRDAAVRANKKAFLINRIGDLGFLIGIALLYGQFGTLDLNALFGADGLIGQASIDSQWWRYGNHSLPVMWLSIAGLAFFLGAMAKSAQFPFHIWLPDAMEGPTSVSSLIHAATMVAAGVFMLVRVSPLFSSEVLLIIACIGAFTAFMAASIALTQNDIKKTLAFSTVSQLGFMMAAIGIGQFGVAIFHLVTHAFFKCLLFLSAGAVIHEMHHLKTAHGLDIDPQDIQNMGGLRKYMPKTFFLTIIGAISLAGLPLTAGYLSKDAILIYAFEWAEIRSSVALLIPLTLLLSSALTAFYIARLVFKVFYGKLRLNGTSVDYHPHEAPKGMWYPMAFLACASFFFCYSYNPLVFEEAWPLNGFPRIEQMERMNIYHTVIPALVNSIAILGVFIAWRWYAQQKYPLSARGGLYRFSFAQWHLDHVYSKLIVKPLLFLSDLLYGFDRRVVDGFVDLWSGITRRLSVLAAWLDQYVVDAFINRIAQLAFVMGGVFRGSRQGKVQHYLLGMFLIFFIVMLLGLKFL